MGVVSASAAGRRAHLQLMRDTCVIKRPSELPGWNPVTRTYVDVPGAVVYIGACRIKAVARAQDVTQGIREVLVNRYDVALPHDTLMIIEPDDLLTVTASSDVWLVGRPLLVITIGLGTTTTARWLTVEDQRG